MNLFFIARTVDTSNNHINLGMFTLIQDRLYFKYIFRTPPQPASTSKTDTIRILKYRNPPNLFYCIDDILYYEGVGIRYFEFKVEYFNQIMTAEEAYEYLLCGKR